MPRNEQYVRPRGDEPHVGFFFLGYVAREGKSHAASDEGDRAINVTGEGYSTNTTISTNVAHFYLLFRQLLVHHVHHVGKLSQKGSSTAMLRWSDCT